MIYINDFKAYNKGNATILKLEQSWNANIALGENIKYASGISLLCLLVYIIPMI